MKNLYDTIILVLFLIFGSIALHSQCSTTGIRNGNNFSNNPGTGTLPWINPTNAITPNSIGSTAAIVVDSSTSVTTHYLYVTNFGFSLPPSAVVCGIEVEIKHKYQGITEPNTIIADNDVYLLNSGGIAGSDHASATPWTTAYTTAVYGSSSDNWGGSFVPANINLSNFGIAISTNLISDSADVFMGANIDYVNIEVFYTIPLPVEIFNLQTNVTNQREVEIIWSTATETNNDYFIVEHSNNGFNWEEIGEVDGAGNSNTIIHYSLLDKQPAIGNNYYRIRQVDFNGTYHYSDIIDAIIHPSEEIEMMYQPASSSISLNTNPVGNIEVAIYDCSGKEVKNALVNPSAESPTVNVDDLVNGIYTVLAISSQQSVVKKFFIYK